MHAEMGYTFRDIPGLTWTEVNTLLLGYMVNQEAEADAVGGHATPTEQRKREHKQSIRRRLMEN